MSDQWIVFEDRPYYPYVIDEVDDLKDALTIAREAASDSKPDGFYENRVIVAKVHTIIPFKDFY